MADSCQGPPATSDLPLLGSGRPAEPLAAEQHRERDQAKRLRKAEVAKGLSGDFMDGWVNLSEWKAAKTVHPHRS